MSPSYEIQPRSASSPFDAVVFAGGGCRCIWQAGFWHEAAPRLELAPHVLAAVSAGSAFACASLAGTAVDILAAFKRKAEANRRNVYPGNVLRGGAVFPHEHIYRSTIIEHLDEKALARIKAGPELRILMARPPAWLGDRASITAAVLAHLLNRRERLVHARWGSRLGFRPEVVSATSCRTP